MLGRRRGFTLIEMLIVIVVVGILTMIVIPRLLYAGRKAKESALRGVLQLLRNAIVQFEADCGDFPAELDQLMNTPKKGSRGGNGIELDLTKWKGPYPKGAVKIPASPFWSETGSAGQGWDYEPTTGKIHSACEWYALDGRTKYSDW